MVQVGSAGINPPNLAAVQELSAGVYRAADHGVLGQAEVWIDDIRVSSPVSTLGKAYALDARLTASDVGELSVSLLGQDGQFRQIGESPSFRTTNSLRVASNVRIDRFLPASLGITFPVNVALTRQGVDPQLITGTDIRGESLEGLRRPRSWSTSYSFSLRRAQRGRSWLVRGMVDPFTVSGNFAQGLNQTELSHAQTSNSTFQVNYNLPLGRFGPVVDLRGMLPGFLRNSDAGKALARSRFNLAPSNIRLSSGLVQDRSELTAYQVAILRDVDTLLLPTQSLNHVWRNSAGVSWQPLGMLTLSGDLISTRDLRHYSDSTPVGRLAGMERRSFLGMDVGVERDRQLSTSLALTPVFTSWLRPRFVHRSGFTLSRSLTSRPPVQVMGDTAGMFVLPQTLNNSRSDEIGASIELSRLLRGALGDSSGLSRALSRIRPLDVSSSHALSSSFDLAAFDPSLNYQLGLGGLQDFLTQYGATAIGATDMTARTVSTGADLPSGISFTLRYTSTDATRYQRIGDALQPLLSSQTEWPSGTLRWTQTFSSGPLTLLALGATFRNRSGQTTQPTAAGNTAVSGITSSSLAPDLQLAFRNGVNITASLSDGDQRTEQNGSTTLLDQDNFNATLTYGFRMPRSFSRSRKRVTSDINVRSANSESCLVLASSSECTPVSATSSQEFSMRFRTDLANLLTGALDFGYLVNEAAHLNRRISTLYMTVSFRLSLFAGDLR